MEWPYSQRRHQLSTFRLWPSSDSLSDTPLRIMLERKHQHLRKAIAVAIAFLCFQIMYFFVSQTVGQLGTDEALHGRLRDKDVTHLGLLQHPFRENYSAKNPWRGAGKRMRSDLIMSVSGCGGKLRKQIEVGDTVRMRFVAVDRLGFVVDSSEKSGVVDVVIGSGQMVKEVDDKLVGLCVGEAVRFANNDGMKYLVYVVKVGDTSAQERDAEMNRMERTIVGIAAERRESCDKACEKLAMKCVENGFQVLNSCDKLRRMFECVQCEEAAAGSAGPDMPCYVSLTAPASHARGYCLISPDVTLASCSAWYEHTRRLCPCEG